MCDFFRTAKGALYMNLHMPISATGGLIAAASKKLTQPMLELGGLSMVKRVVLSFQQMGLFPIVVVTGVEADEVKYQLAGRGVVFVHNDAFEDPELLDSVKLGLSFLQNMCERIAFTPVNVPMFLPSTLNALLKSQRSIAIPTYGGKEGHPVVISNDLIHQLLTWRGDAGLRGYIDSQRESCETIVVEDEGILLSIHDRERLLEHYEKNQKAFLHPYLRLSLEREDELFNARAKLLLLLIGKTHSTRTAAGMMALSPSKAWDMLNQLESVLGYALITRHKGGSQGSRSELTSQGLEFLRAWQQYEEQTLSFANASFEHVRSFLCATESAVDSGSSPE